MATDRTNRLTIIGRVGLLGVSAGLFLGLFEAACLRLTDIPMNLGRPHVTPSFWFFAPLLASVVFGSIGLLAGLLAAYTRSRFVGMVIITGFIALAPAYLMLVLGYTQAASDWFLPVRHFFTPPIIFAVVFAWTLAALWATRKPDSPLGF